VTPEPPLPFDICGPLPTGTTVLEASAGTGKTFTIAALATRYVAEGTATLSQLMLVTFSRSATQELRERVRARLVSAERALADPARARADATDTLVQLLADVDDAEVSLRRRRLVRALADFDAATIATVHGFCQQMLAGLGMAGDYEPGTTSVENIDDLVSEVVDDLYLRLFAGSTQPPPIDYACAAKVAKSAVGDRQAQLVPTDADPGSVAHARVELALATRGKVQARKRARGLIDYDDLLVRLRDVLVDPQRGEIAIQRLRSRYRVVLVDEFQDTDPVQWEILATAFHGHTTLVLIGDPKQAIYAFRGADLVTYLQAATAAGAQRTLSRNWRSDRELIDALQIVFGGAAMGDPRIVVHPVSAQHQTRRLDGAGAAMRIRVMARPQAPSLPGKSPGVDAIRAVISDDVAYDIVTLLTAPTSLSIDDEARPLRPGDIAVIVSQHKQAAAVRAALAAANVPAVESGARSVFQTNLAREWLTLLRAVEQPHRPGLVRAAAMTCFLGWTAEQLATASAEQLDDLGPRVRGWRDLLVTRGVAAMLEVVTAGEQLVERMLGQVNGERDLTDLRHVGETLHAAATTGQLGPVALVEWLERRINEPDSGVTDGRSWRLDSDADAVQILTVHGSKGLEFPVVYVPFAWNRYSNSAPDPLLFHAADGTRRLDVGGPGTASYAANRVNHEAEDAGEELRLLYVALTRAQCQVVTWWAPSANTTTSAMQRLLVGTVIAGQDPPAKVPVPNDAAARQRLDAVAAGSGGNIAVESVADDRSASWTPPVSPAPSLTAGSFARSLDTVWRRTSFSGLTAGLHEAAMAAGVTSEPEVDEVEDEPDTPQPVNPDEAADEDAELRAVASPMAALPAGAVFGTMVHEVLELVDPSAADLEAELRARCRDVVSRRLGVAIDPDELAAALLPVMQTSLGEPGGHTRLADLATGDRLVELDFELPMAGGDEPHAVASTLTELGALLRTHLPASDLLVGYPDALDAAGIGWQQFRGYLAGSIDAVLRVRDPAGEPRYLVVDYKTNWLGGFGPRGPEPLTTWHYRPAAMAAEMQHSHYPLQALLYSVALHRFLRWRQPGYDPTRHLGGVLYLFLRGMAGPSTPVVDGMPCGVFTWQPPVALIEDLSALLDGADAR
jgi:exodeoxyribonuclease V beta subunit